MPNIRTFEAPALGLQPTETGVEATAQAANRIGRFYNQQAAGVAEVGHELARGATTTINAIGEKIIQYQEHREISQGAATFAQLQADLTDKWNDTAKKADPNDPSVSAKFTAETLEPALQQFNESFQTDAGKKFAEAHIEALRTHMFQKTAADMSSLAADAVAVNMRTISNSLSNTATNDGSAVPHLLATADSLVAGVIDSSPNVKGPTAAKARMEMTQKIKEEIVKNGAIGAITRAADPEAEADKWGKAYPEFISGADLKMLAANARQQIRARNYDYELGRRRLKEDMQDRSTEATNQYIIDMRSRDPTIQNDPTATKILNDPNLTKQDKTNLLNLADRQLKPETDARLSSKTFTGLLGEMRAPNADLDAVMQKAWEARLKEPGQPGSLSERDFNQFRQEVVARKTPEGAALERDRSAFFKQYAKTIDKNYDPVVGSPALYAAEMGAREQEAYLRQKGLDPHLVYDPRSEYFFGNPKNLARYQLSMQDATQQAAEIARRSSLNLTGPGKAITGVEVSEPSSFRPPPGWQFSPSRQMYRDAEGKLYDMTGKPVKP